MKLGVVSDIHGSLTAFKEAKDYLKDSDLLLIAGDILYHGARNPLPAGYDTEGVLEELKEMEEDFLAVKGNVDALVDDWVLPYPLSEYTVVEDNGRRIAIYHGYQDETAEERANFAHQLGADILVFGHTHLPLIEEVNGVILLNPGSIALPKQKPAVSTIAQIDEKQIKLIALESKEVLKEYKLD
ncbi:phosphoesterase, MJ0936 family [Halobacteroides halobius DSM 5150]|uniref:Phosphoesterase n=1 Tax=Halobacteroides halobius (strain ATCC 35273 / DSM 5150 / MD-1) TaxID=748449 RepID=L0K9W0_HALHC|nr:phosphodiesterase [Halobacteroides halobius]AGB40888.1 phosphoesterase, MJ0936 family [Halobacteroides halobius DSM 5150]